jgi:hypothetical protein
MAMVPHELTTPEGALRRLQPISERLYRAWRAALLSARSVFWDKDGNELLPYEPWLFCHHARTHAINNLVTELSTVPGVDVDTKTIMSSVMVRTDDGLQLLFRKSDEGEVPVVGPSETRQRWCAQQLPGLEEELDELHLMATWDVDPASHELLPFVLSMPAHGGSTRDSMHMHWDIDLVEIPEQRIADLDKYRRKPKADTGETGTGSSDQ